MLINKMFNVSTSVFLYGCDVYSAPALGRKLENVKFGVHDFRNDRDVLSVDGKLMKKCNKMLLKKLGCVILWFPEMFHVFPSNKTRNVRRNVTKRRVRASIDAVEKR